MDHDILFCHKGLEKWSIKVGWGSDLAHFHGCFAHIVLKHWSTILYYRAMADKERIKLLHILRAMNVGGIETLVEGLLRNHDRGKFELRVLVLTEGGGAISRFEDIKDVPLDRCIYSPPARKSFLKEFERYLCSTQPNAIVCWFFPFHYFLSRVARRVGIKTFIVGVQNTQTVTGVQKFKNAFLARWSRRWIKTEVAASERVKLSIREQYCLNVDKVPVIRNGIDATLFLPKDSVRRKGESESQVTVGMVARLDRIKDHDTLIRAIGIASHNFPGKIELQLIGDGPRRKELEVLAHEIEVRDIVDFMGTRDDVPDLLNGMDMFVFSTTDAEGLGNAMVEAMACELPVIATNTGACPEVVRDGQTGLLVPERDPQKLAEAIVFMAKNPSLRKQFGIRGREVVCADFNIYEVVRHYEELLLDEM